MSKKIDAGSRMPEIALPKAGGGEVNLGGDGRWQGIVVYRGKHCPLCKPYLNGLGELRESLTALGAEVMAISADPLEKVQADIDEFGWEFDVGYDLNPDQMRDLGLYISNPRTDRDETDRPFAEPGLFVVQPDGNVHIIDISNAPFARADLTSLPGYLKYIIENDYPVRGTAS